MYEITKSSLIYEKALSKLNLIDDLQLLQSLELAFLEVKQHKHNKELLKQKMTHGNR